jgi:Na+-driven multidrug efflux pump
VVGAVLSAAGILAVNSLTGLGIYSVPLGGLASSALAGAGALAALRRAGVRRPRLAVRREGLSALWRIGAPVGATQLLLSTVGLGYLRVLRGATPAEVSGFSLGQTATFTFTMLAVACGSGAAIAVGMRPAADRSALHLAGVATLLRVVVPACAAAAAAAFAVRRPLARALAGDGAVADAATTYLTWVSPTLVLFGGSPAILTFLEQVGRARTAFLLNAAYFAAMLAAAFALPGPVHTATLAKLVAAGNTVGFFTLTATTFRLLRRARRPYSLTIL